MFQRSQIWWIAYYDNGREHCESSSSRERKDAVRILRQRLGEVAFGMAHSDVPKRKRARAVMMQDLFDLVEHNH